MPPIVQLHAAILAGGSGTRFWPVSVRGVPKQLLALTGGAPLLRQTYERLDGLVPPERVVVVTAARFADDVRRLLPELPAENVLGEPAARNTAPACALAAHWAARQSPDATLLVVPADHVVSPAEELRAKLLAAARRADAAGTLVTLGLEPTRAATGYGWIRVGPATACADDGATVHAVDRFVEKPDRARAEAFLAQGGHLWNLGMFAWRADAFLCALGRHLPEVASAFADAAPSLGGADQDAALARAFAAVPSISVDCGVLEREPGVEVVPCSFRWDDLGSFAALARNLPTDEHGNLSVGPVVARDSTGCVAWAAAGRMTALLGVDDLIVVHAHGVTLVAPRSRAEEVRRLVDALAAQGLDRFG